MLFTYIFFLSIQNEVETALAENSALGTACQAAVKAKEESKEKSTMAEVSDLFEICSPTPTVPCLLIDNLCCMVYKIWLSMLDQSAGVGGTAKD